MALPTLLNQDVTISESYVPIPSGTRQILAQCRTAVDVRFAFETGKVAGPTANYGTIKAGTGFNPIIGWDAVSTLPPDAKLYLAAGSTVVLEIMFCR